jgi:hypothetical protein
MWVGNNKDPGSVQENLFPVHENRESWFDGNAIETIAWATVQTTQPLTRDSGFQ